MRIVTFHTENEQWFDTPHPLGGRKHPHTELVALFLASVRHTNPKASLELLTDYDSKVVEQVGFDKVWRSAIKQDALMLERMRAQRRLLASAEVGDLFAFLDTDILVQRDLTGVFTHKFDIGVTIRDKPVYEFERKMPYNNGVLFVRTDNRGAALSYFDRLIQLLEGLNSDAWAWSGNQFVVRDLLGHHPPGTMISVDDALVRVFACSEHNYTPAGPDEDVSAKCILHFRGEAKSLMQVYSARSGESK